MLEYILLQSKQRWLNAVEVDAVLSETNAQLERVQAPDMSQWDCSQGAYLPLNNGCSSRFDPLSRKTPSCPALTKHFFIAAKCCPTL